jgi:small subunit ribosomal protein S2
VCRAAVERGVERGGCAKNTTEEEILMVSAMDQVQESTIVSMRQLLDAGVHFGHQAKRWNPKMRSSIFGERNGIHIIDLQQTVAALAAAQDFVTDVVADGGTVLFVGTKKQGQEVVREAAERSGMASVTYRWLGGLLTNFVTIRNRLRYMNELENRQSSGELDLLPKTEQLKLRGELARLQQNLGGIRTLRRLPEAIFIIDPRREQIAVKEAGRLGIPIIAMVDTNCDPDPVDYVIPANDDAIRSIRLIVGRIADAAIQGRLRRETARGDAEQQSLDNGEMPEEIMQDEGMIGRDA